MTQRAIHGPHGPDDAELAFYRQLLNRLPVRHASCATRRSGDMLVRTDCGFGTRTLLGFGSLYTG